MIGSLLLGAVESAANAVTSISPLDAALGAALAAVAAMAAVALARWIARRASALVRWFARQAAEELEERHGAWLDARLDAKLAEMKADLTYVRAQLDYNGGSTVKDKVAYLVSVVNGPSDK